MIGQHFDDFTKPITGSLLHPLRRPAVEAGALPLRETIECHVPNQHVFEDVLALPFERTVEPGPNQVATFEPVQQGIGLPRSESEQRGHRSAPEDTAHYGSALQSELLRSREQVDAGCENRLDGVRDVDFGDLLVGAPPIPRANDGALVDQPAKDLLNEERVAFGPAEDVPANPLGHRLDVKQQGDQPARLILGEWVEHDAGEVAPSPTPAGGTVGELRPGGAHEQDRPLDAFGQVFEQRQKRRVCPVNVFDLQDQRALGGDGREELPPGRLDLVFDLAR